MIMVKDSVSYSNVCAEKLEEKLGDSRRAAQCHYYLRL